MNTDLNKIISDRLAKDKDLFFVDTSVVSSKFGKEIIKKKKLHGVRHSGGIVIHPIFESVDIVADDVAIVEIKKSFALFSLSDGSRLTDFDYRAAEVINDVVVLKKDNGRSALFDLRVSDFFHKAGDYEEYNLKDSSTEYVWARRNNHYDYIHRATRTVISLPGIVMAYDTASGIFGLSENNKICLFDEYGAASDMALRQAVMNEGGHLTLFNYTYNIRHVIDIYGNILNI